MGIFGELPFLGHSREILIRLLEQEEHPPIVPNFGMGSSLVNYYRKKDEKDDHMPKVAKNSFSEGFIVLMFNSLTLVSLSFSSLKTSPHS